MFFQKDNSEKEWAFKHAIRIKTYSTHHPVPVPMNLVSNLVQLPFLLKRKCNGEGNGKGNGKKEKEKETEKNEEDVSKNEGILPPRYYARKYYLVQFLTSPFLVQYKGKESPTCMRMLNPLRIFIKVRVFEISAKH